MLGVYVSGPKEKTDPEKVNPFDEGVGSVEVRSKTLPVIWKYINLRTISIETIIIYSLSFSHQHGSLSDNKFP